MLITDVQDTANVSRADVVEAAKKNAAAAGYVNKDGVPVVHVADINTDILVSKKSLVHGLDRRLNTQAPVLMKIGDILKNAVRINELLPRQDNASNTYVLIGAAKSHNRQYVVSFVVNRFSNELTSVDVLYAMNAKKEPAALLPKLTAEAATPTGSAISISELLDYVNRYFPDILPESVLKHYGHTARPEGKLGESALYSERENGYSYEALVSKPDIPVTQLSNTASNNRADIVAAAKKNAAAIGTVNNDNSITVHVQDIDTDVVIGTKGLRHSLDRRLEVNGPVALKAGEILQGSIRINELTPEFNEADASYVLVGVAQDLTGKLYVVRSVVNRFSSELVSMDVLYAINAKKESTAVLNAPRVSRPSYRTTISISELLDYVNRYFPDILPESVLKHYGHAARPEGKLGGSALYSERDSAAGLTAEEAQAQKEAYTQLKAETAMLRRRIAYWKGQIHKSDKPSIRREDTNRLVNSLMREFGSRAEKLPIKDAMEALGNYIVQHTGAELSYEEIYQQAQAIAADILDGAC